MATLTETKTAERTEPIRLSRIYHAPPMLVFEAWSSADHVSRWFRPDGYSVPECKIELKVGGAFEVCMLAPDGSRHWTRGAFTEVVAPKRLAFDTNVTDADGRVLFRAFTVATFEAAPGGTRLEVEQSYEIVAPEARFMIGGAPQGWGQTLDALGREIIRMQGVCDEPSVVHSMFQLERTYDAPAERVWRALSEFDAKAKWFGGDPAQWAALERSMDFRVGGRERARGRWGESGVVSTFEALYHDIVPGRRIVYTYEMHLDERKISVSLATMEITPLPGGRATLKVVEHGAFLDGYVDGGSREHGTGYLLDRLGASLKD